MGNPEPSSPWIMTATGGQWPYLAPTPAHVDFRDIALMLARQSRWNGATEVPPGKIYSIAQHSVVVCHHVANPDWKLYGLLHDAHEAYTGDIPTPMKRALDALGGNAALADLQARADAAIFAAAGLTHPMPKAIATAIKHADMRALATEKLLLMPEGRGQDWTPEAKPFPNARLFSPWEWSKAAEAFLKHLEVLMPFHQHEAMSARANGNQKQEAWRPERPTGNVRRNI